MPSEVILPRVDMDMATGKISKWFVESGAKVSKGQPLFEIETDKAAMEIEAPSSGTIRDLAAAPSDDIPVGSVVAWIDAEGEAAGSNAKSLDARPEARAPPREAPPSTPGPAPASPPLVAAVAGPCRATPLARRLARLKGIDLMALQGSGPRGRVVASDVVAGEGVAEAASAELDSPEPRPVVADHGQSQQSRQPARSAGPSSTQTRLVSLREGTGTPVVLIHGFGADAGSWRPFLSGRSVERPILALDLPGHGASPLGADASFEGVVDAVEGALLDTDLRAFHLVGHSLGGAVATALTARGAVDVQSLLLLSPAGLGPEIDGDFLRGFLGATSPASMTPWLRHLVVDGAFVTPAFVSSTLKARAAAGGVGEQRRIAEALFPDDTQSFSIRRDLERLAIPTRVVFGACDRIIPPRHLRGLPGIVAAHLFPNVGHLPHLEAPQAVASILLQMIAR